ncbi:hypothetical protein [Pseudobutyrivibrio xylanivorans]|uniref:hypothetical protein n=1 Tax=Pseudobutyrivibrio xylanivorans TaxID=185007 RepID=UPI00142F0F63|nr:hypothetical protein [Pseudobutyrivibrio xylanivorans]
MEDVRVSVRLTPEMHEKLKIIAIKRKTNMNQILVEYIRRIIEEEEQNNAKGH